MPTIVRPARFAGIVLRNAVDLNDDRASSHEADWSWPPYAPCEPAEVSFSTEEWAPASTVRRPWLRLGRWTLLYRRAA
jgi:hypothetical protein